MKPDVAGLLFYECNTDHQVKDTLDGGQKVATRLTIVRTPCNEGLTAVTRLR